MTSFGVERLDKLDHVMLGFVLDFLLLQPQIVVVLVVRTHHHLIQMPNNPYLRIRFDVVITPLLQLAFLHVNLALVHNLQVQLVILIEGLYFAILCVLNQLQHVVTIHDYLLLLLSAHIAA